MLSSYNGARRLPMLTPLLAREGLPVLLHGTRTQARHGNCPEFAPTSATRSNAGGRTHHKSARNRKNWGSEGVRRVAAHGIVGGFTGGISGIVGAVSDTLGAPSVADALRENDIPEPLADTNDWIGEYRSGRPDRNTVGAASAVYELFGNYLADNFENRTDCFEERIAASELFKEELVHPFRLIKRHFGHGKVSFRSLQKNEVQLRTLFALSNLWMACQNLVALQA